MEMVADKKDDRGVHRVGKVVTKEGTKAKSAETVFFVCFSC